MSTTTNLHLPLNNNKISADFTAYNEGVKFTTASVHFGENTVTYFFTDNSQLLDFTRSMASLVEQAINFLTDSEEQLNNENSSF